MHLVGLYSWEEVEFKAREKTQKPEATFNSRGRRRRAERPEGKYLAKVEMEFGIWRLTVEGPGDDHPTGWLTLESGDVVEGPLDPSTWTRFADHIKQRIREIKNVA